MISLWLQSTAAVCKVASAGSDSSLGNINVPSLVIKIGAGWACRVIVISPVENSLPIEV